ncbi:MAG: hypothetical protein WCJ17_03660 [bacterium]
MQCNLKKVPILLLLLTTQCTFIAAADDGPAGAGSGASDAEHPLIGVIRHQILRYCQEKSKLHDTTQSHVLMATLTRFMPQVTADTFWEHLVPAQKNLLAHSQQYTECAHILSEAKNKILAIMEAKIDFTEEEIAASIYSLIYALATDLIYNHLQHYQTTAPLRKNIREVFGICSPASETPWHQDILEHTELPHFRIVDATDVNDIMEMVHRWTITSMIMFLRKQVEDKTFSPAEAFAVDTYLVHTLMPLRSYAFNGAQKKAVVDDAGQREQFTKCGPIKKSIKEKQSGYIDTLIHDLFHQEMICHILSICNAENMAPSIIRQLKTLPCFDIPSAPCEPAPKGKNRKGKRK